jgi:hypothetical protein
MSYDNFKTPIALLIFNRPEATRRVFEEIKRMKPSLLLVVADGPRSEKPGEREKCAASRAIVENIDWPCNVLMNYSDVNLGCKQRVSSGLDWVFRNVEEAIILEDDCLPHHTFFRFCEELLIKYRSDERIMMISGDNFQSVQKRTPYSYYFSTYPHIWGWASWRRAWRYYDVTMSLWPEIADSTCYLKWFSGHNIARYWKNIFDQAYRGEINTWDHQWHFACRVKQGMIILPNVNLVSNIGFDHDATHTTRKSIFSNIKTEPMKFPLLHPPHILLNTEADSFTEKIMFSNRSMLLRVIYTLKRIWHEV